MTIVLDGFSLTIDKLVRIARHGEQVEVDPVALDRINRCRAMVDQKLALGEVIYGVNTGIGEFSEVLLSDEQIGPFQRYLVLSHAAGIGEPASIETVRAAMASRINVHARGYSGSRPVITQTLADMLNLGVTPVVCQQGSVGASGDLAPMAQVALVLMGEGEAWYEGKRLPGGEAVARAGISPPGLHARDGLATINGSNVTTAMSALQLYDIERWLRQAEIACAMTLEALLANLEPFDVRLHELRGFSGAIRAATAITKVVDGSDLQSDRIETKVQDAYSMRSSPQVIGAALDAVAYAHAQVEIELNAVADNPIFLADEGVILTGANFQGTPVSLPMDLVGAAVTTVCVLSERRLNRLTNPALSGGLPAFLTSSGGMFSGMMLSQYTADTLIVEQRMLSAPSSVQSIPAAADQEDFVSMAMNTAIKNGRILENANGVLGIEFMAAAQALDLRDFTPGRGTRAARDVIRRHVPHLHEDRPLYVDHDRMRVLVESGEILDAVEAEVGRLHDTRQGAGARRVTAIPPDGRG
ncbi:MAG: aromatic amino acid ammonia-lyase [Chloroflexota bacterium]